MNVNSLERYGRGDERSLQLLFFWGLVLEMKNLLQKVLATFHPQWYFSGDERSFARTSLQLLICRRCGPGDERSVAKLSLHVLILGSIVLEIKSLSVEALAVITRAI